jgi:hypothetical protein
MLHNRLSQLFQRESDRLLKSFLGDNPDLLKKYVDGGVVAVGAVLGPINSFMRHLLTVQGLDPDTTPGEKQRALVQEALASFFEKVHDKALDEDYDLSWVRQRFEDTRKNFSKFNLTQAKFMELTDLSRIPTRVEDVSKEKLDDLVQRVNPVADPAPKRETSIALDDAIQQLRDFMTKIEKSQPEEKAEEKQHAGIKTGKKSVNKSKGYGKGAVTRGTGTRVRKISADYPVQIKEPTIKEELAAKRSQEFTERAVKLVHDMIDRGLVEGTVKAVEEQTKQIMTWSEESLAAMERVVAKHFKQPSDNKFTGSFRRVKK